MIISSVIAAVFTQRLMSELQEGGARPAVKTPDEIVLFLDLNEGFSESPSSAGAFGFADPFAPQPLTLYEMINTLDVASRDPHVKGILARMDSATFPVAHIQELRRALERFKAAGKFSYIYSPSYGEAGDFGAYYLASVFDEIWMQPMGIVSISGIHMEVPYFKPVLDKIGVKTEFMQRKEYKTAYESVSKAQMSPENRRMLGSLLESTKQALVGEISKSRAMTEAQLKSYVDQAIFTTDEALKAKLIDHAGYSDEMLDEIKIAVAGSVEAASDDIFVHVQDYRPDARGINGNGPQVALIYASGMILQSSPSRAQSSVFGGQNLATAQQLVPAIWDAIEDPKIRVIVLRIDSPGGSPVASESILRALQKAQEKGKPVIVSMGPTAASGGYWIASYADRIYAMPTTLTGSIGVVGGKFSLSQMWQEIGVNWDDVSWGKNSGVWSINSAFSPSQKARADAMLDNVYNSFIYRVSEGRAIKKDDVETIAKGRVWSGTQAQENGLVDELGGLHDALDYAAALTGVKGRNQLRVKILPRPKTLVERLLDMMSEYGQVQAAIHSVIHMPSQALQSAQSAWQAVMAVSELPNSGAVYEPATPLR